MPKNPITGTWTKRDDKSGKFLDVKTESKPFTGARNKKIMRNSAKRFARAMKRLASR